MEPDDEHRFSGLMADTSNAYGREVDPGVERLYWMTLKAYPFEEVEGAFFTHMKTGEFFPRPADLIRHIEGPAESRALAAWDTARLAVAQVGSYHSVRFQDRAIMATLAAMGGWRSFCMMGEEDRDRRRKQFIEQYRESLAHPPAHIPASLPGHFESDQAGKWGDDERARAAAEPVLITPDGAQRPRLVPVETKALPPAPAGTPKPDTPEFSAIAGAMKRGLRALQGKERES